MTGKVESDYKERKCSQNLLFYCFRKFRKYESREETENKPFACKLCNYTATRNINLQNHIKTHASEKVIVCEICDAKTTTMSSLRKHLETHTIVVCRLHVEYVVLKV